MRSFKSIGLFLLFALPPSDLAAQACCSAGTPLLSSLELPTTPAGSWQFSLTYQYNLLRDIVSVTERLDDESRRRATHSALLEVSYGLTRSVSITGLVTLVQQERRISAPMSTRTGEFLRTRGIGDAVLLVKYNIVPLNIVSQREIAIGAGPKIPLGKSRLSSEGILLPADMQPGTGAWDGVLWAYAYQGFLPTIPINVFATASYRLTGTNDRFAAASQEGYKFGNEFIATLGTSYRTDWPFDLSFQIRYRSVAADRFSSSEVPNTGGKWIYFLPGLNVNLFDELSLRFSGQIPVHRKLEGTQLTTSYTLSLSLFYSIMSSPFPLGEKKERKD